MSETLPDKKFTRRQIGFIFKIAFLEAMALAIIMPTTFSTGEITPISTCSLTNGLCGPIRFDNIQFQNSTSSNSANSFLTSTSWLAGQNQTMIVVASSQNSFFPPRTRVSSVTDSIGDSFNLVIQVQANSALVSEPTDLEIWSGVVKTQLTNAVTVTWNGTNANSNMVQVVVYDNVASIGSSVSTTFICPCSGSSASLSLTTSKSGEWIFGAIAVQSIPGTPQTTPCPGQVGSDSSGFVTRNKGCSTPGGTDGVETWVSDNNTSIRNSVTVTYNPQPISSAFGVDVEIELFPVDLEPNQQSLNTSTLCFTTGDTCHVNMVIKSTGANVATNVVVGTAYCTGITTPALTTTKTTNLRISGQYGAQSRNDTGAVLLFQLEISTSAPSTTFGSGQCASGNTIVSAGKITFDTSGTTLTLYGLNEYFGSSIGQFGMGAGSYYAWIEITPQSVGNVNTGVANLGSTIQFAQWGIGASSSIDLLEIS